jgi:hypothetical protein
MSYMPQISSFSIAEHSDRDSGFGEMDGTQAIAHGRACAKTRER